MCVRYFLCVTEQVQAGLLFNVYSLAKIYKLLRPFLKLLFLFWVVWFFLKTSVKNFNQE